MKNRYLLTKEGKEELEQELQYLKENQRKELSERIKRGRMFCDFTEDVSFRDLLIEQTKLEKRVNELELILYDAEIIKNGERHSGVVELGSVVTFIEILDGEKEMYQIVLAVEVNPSNDKISIPNQLLNN